ncbi:SHOCT domain-containing protein [Enterococcus thailandicus]|uniref:SHOCT domain-containing protein n=1 Tax=Enterococcus thailandicus TaxID=417368 RepID=UPI0022EBB5FE|nr:SHOCT domain-containing protein [Enterococcus thailandicus]MDA3973252.1 SHOCT domain-containing protein [Enterococcus thailandicus]MDA3976162.1 SHOCT domain-containing protein [Enterococcus thailandicus]MDA3980712.1 SHOCT domain-containing protein [Enterococcus thailandicus]
MDNEIIASVKGLNGIVKVFSDKVVISRKTAMGFVTQGIKGDREIFFSDIKSIEFKKATMMANGYIQFITNIETARNQKVGLIGTTRQASEDPNSVIIRAFSKKTVQDSIKVYEKSTELLKDYKDSVSSKVNFSATDEIKKYKELLDLEIITQEEFEMKKKSLLDL